ncbi:phage portal protein [Zhihengliuella halotolerans]|uniref:Phage portal protein BeeE n=1 Tax=Zhihengliuella halotolerans TaxID=370736 RepID=A0A4Q8ACV1_9MICC|nr:phage portal protein [Zhihengliuella halotolerans]RZU61443.1 phage portal protein BeeE [Zhihengliuella halotolerans]
MGFFDFLRGGTSGTTSGVTSPWAPEPSELERMTLADLVGLTPEDVIINRETTVGIPAVAKGLNLIKSSVARLPMVVYRNDQIAPLQPPFLNQLEPGIQNHTVIAYAVEDLILYGKAFFLITKRNTQGQAQQVKFVPHSEAEYERGILKRAFGEVVNPREFFRIDYINEGIINFGRDALKEMILIEKAAYRAGASPLPHLILRETSDKGKLSSEQKTSLIQAYSSERRKAHGSISLISSNLEPIPIGQTNENLLLEARNANAINAARILMLPASYTDAFVSGTSLSYTNIASRNKELLEAINPAIEAMEAAFSYYLVPYGSKIKFDTSELTKDDKATRFQNYQTGLAAGFLTVNEVRELEGLEPLPEPEQPVREEEQDEQEQT